MPLPESLNTIAIRLANADLTPHEEKVRKAILRYFSATGTSPTVGDLMAHVPGFDDEGIVRVCRRLGEEDLIVWDEARMCVQSAYPFSGLPTLHTVHLRGGPEIFALCAVDALGIPVMLGQAAHIDSRCAYCHTAVEVPVRAEGLGRYSPGDSVVWYPLAEDACCPVAQSRCPDINFFCSAEHGDAWWKTKDRPEGFWMTMGEAFEAGREIFGALLETPESVTR